jgi:hypothetical protein
MEARQRGHGIVPGGSDELFALIVEQRLSAHLMQSSCSQPEGTITDHQLLVTMKFR